MPSKLQIPIFSLSEDFFVVVNTPPVAGPGRPYLVAIGGTVTLNSTGSTDDDGEPLTCEWFVEGGSGTISNATDPKASFTADNGAGIFDDVCLTVNDGIADSKKACTYVVIYDPTAGFVTGSGWIESPEGAYTEDETATGKATFGFVSKYNKGATSPTGQTDFQFDAGNLEFFY